MTCTDCSVIVRYISANLKFWSKFSAGDNGNFEL
jgi:hypothetical protein